MVVDRAWVVRNLGFDPIATQAPQSTFAVTAAATKSPNKDGTPNANYFTKAKSLFKANSDQLPKDNTRAPKIMIGKALTSSVVTTDFFGFDTSNNYYGLKGWGAVSEMGDAVLGLVAKQMGTAAPRWVAVRNVSDPQIKAEGTINQQAQTAAQIYKAYGRWSSVCSAIVCWALIAAEK